MSESISLQYLAPSNGASDAGALTIEVRDHALFGKEAKLEIVVVGKVNRSGGIDEQDVVFEHVLTLAPSQSVALPLHLLERYRFQGRGLSIELYAELSVKLGLLQSTKVRLDLGPEEVAQENVKAMTDPKDSVKLAVNFKFLPFDAKIKVAGLGLIGIFVALLGLLVGVHDQKVPEKEAYFFDHHTSKGKSESPLMKGLVGGGLFGVGIYIAIQYQLGRYMKLEIKSPETLGHDAKVPIAQLVRGKAYAPISRAQLKVVAYNVERGVCRVFRKKRHRREGFKSPVRAVYLFEQELSDIPAGTDIAPYLRGEVDFAKAYRELLPPQSVNDSTGIEIAWEVQFLHDDFVDHQIEGDSSVFDRTRFSARKWS